ncbi:hypothetical protein HMF3257_04075 [Spirosoma telluris]|uniref:Uncharacterized protein n=1 Tax=Spirosoma telluris TaxID=2183553 RepID=A0A327NF49_9BACT|nr:hypothetical protein HMF3257_04075 [Spirosoma telluris]
MFGLNPFSRSVAITEILLLLLFIAFVGWLISQLVFRKRISKLLSRIEYEEAELHKCYKLTN